MKKAKVKSSFKSVKTVKSSKDSRLIKNIKNAVGNSPMDETRKRIRYSDVTQKVMLHDYRAMGDGRRFRDKYDKLASEAYGKYKTCDKRNRSKYEGIVHGCLKAKAKIDADKYFGK